MNTEKYPVIKIDYKILTDEDEMPTGRHKGKKMKDVPAKDLIWLHEQGWANKSVTAYVVDNWDMLCQQAGRKKK